MKWNNDIKDYLRGSRKGKPANRLEREALSDPFLYEALEGLTSTSGDPIDGLIRLERNLEERARSVKTNKRSWLYIAASFLVLAMCGILWFVGTGDKSKVLEKEMAQLEPRGIRSENDKAVLYMGNDSVLRIEAVDSSKVADSIRRRMLRTALPEQAKVMMEVKDEAVGSVNDEMQSADTVNHDMFRLQMKKGIVSTDMVRGVVTDGKGNLLPGVTVIVTGTSVGTVTDEQGTFQLRLPEGKTHLTFSFVGMKVQGVVVKPGTQIQVKLEEDQRKLEEAVVTGYSAVKKRSVVGAVTTVSGNESKKDTVVSSNDIARFNHYMVDALKYPETDVKNGNEGIILVSFELNKKKVPSRIRIKDGFSKESNKELIRLLAESPKWESSLSGKRIYASVRFTIGKSGAKHTAVLVTEKPWK